MTTRATANLTLVALVAVMLLPGCGMNPAATKKPKARPIANALQGQPMGAIPLPGQGLPGVPGAADPAVAQMLNGLRQAQQSIQGFSCTVETYDKGPKGTESDILKVWYKKPNSLKIEVVKGEGQAQGAKILWTGGGSIKIKPSFVPFTVDKSLSDPGIVSKNGWTLRETEVNSIFKVMFDPAAKIVPLGMQAPTGQPLLMFDVTSTQSPKGATHEQIGISQQTGLPGVRMLFKGQELIYRLNIKNMNTKAPSSSEMDV